MSFLIIAVACVLFFILFLFQIFLGRIMKPSSEDKFIILLYVITPLVLFFVSWFVNFFGMMTSRDAVRAYLLFFVFSASWVASYPAIYAACPTLIISLVINKNRNGTTLEELKELLSLKQNSVERIEDAIQDKLIKKDGDQIELTAIGNFVFFFFKVYRRILGLKINTI